MRELVAELVALVEGTRRGHGQWAIGNREAGSLDETSGVPRGKATTGGKKATKAKGFFQSPCETQKGNGPTRPSRRPEDLIPLDDDEEAHFAKF
jgi:hypothetical protein